MCINGVTAVLPRKTGNTINTKINHYRTSETPLSESIILSLDSIRLDGGTQPRADLFQNVIDDYAEAMKAGATFPPIVAFFDGTNYWLADGFHRVRASIVAGLKGIDADIRQGTQRDAVLFSVGANAVHGMRRTTEDKQRAIEPCYATRNGRLGRILKFLTSVMSTTRRLGRAVCHLGISHVSANTKISTARFPQWTPPT
jgi:hypothetical protein